MSDTKVIDLIDRQRMADELNRIADCAEATGTEDPMIMVSDILKMLYWQPSQTDYEMVRHGKWKDAGICIQCCDVVRCSECGHEELLSNVIEDGNYCQCCGAKMDVEGDIE